MHHHPRNRERALNLSILSVSGPDLGFPGAARRVMGITPPDRQSASFMVGTTTAQTVPSKVDRADIRMGRRRRGGVRSARGYLESPKLPGGPGLVLDQPGSRHPRRRRGARERADARPTGERPANPDRPGSFTAPTRGSGITDATVAAWQRRAPAAAADDIAARRRLGRGTAPRVELPPQHPPRGGEAGRPRRRPTPAAGPSRDAAEETATRQGGRGPDTEAPWPGRLALQQAAVRQRSAVRSSSSRTTTQRCSQPAPTGTNSGQGQHRHLAREERHLACDGKRIGKETTLLKVPNTAEALPMTERAPEEPARRGPFPTRPEKPHRSEPTEGKTERKAATETATKAPRPRSWDNGNGSPACTPHPPPPAGSTTVQAGSGQMTAGLRTRMRAGHVPERPSPRLGAAEPPRRSRGRRRRRATSSFFTTGHTAEEESGGCRHPPAGRNTTETGQLPPTMPRATGFRPPRSDRLPSGKAGPDTTGRPGTVARSRRPLPRKGEAPPPRPRHSPGGGGGSLSGSGPHYGTAGHRGRPSPLKNSARYAGNRDKPRPHAPLHVPRSPSDTDNSGKTGRERGTRRSHLGRPSRARGLSGKGPGESLGRLNTSPRPQSTPRLPVTAHQTDSRKTPRPLSGQAPGLRPGRKGTRRRRLAQPPCPGGSKRVPAPPPRTSRNRRQPGRSGTHSRLFLPRSSLSLPRPPHLASAGERLSVITWTHNLSQQAG
ncbi:basic salivary proline-rich protein 2-like [Cinclus cinclus]|uniref:basic salivary proline-rich protein 2-like n=1 Tax=Cinclus cinclus TaxID=127875 RepID=UPI002E150EFB